MDGKPNLIAVPYQNGSFYRLKDQNLIVVVKNVGTDTAKKTTTRVEFGGYGTCRDANQKTQDRETKPLEPGEEVELVFDAAAENCFYGRDCEVHITVDANSVLGDPPPRKFSGVAHGTPIRKPDLVPVVVGVDGGKLTCKVQNQGTAYARSSTAQVEFKGYEPIRQSTSELDPGYDTVISVDIPKDLYKPGNELNYTITLDVGNVVDEENKNNNVAQGVFKVPSNEMRRAAKK